ncbi:MAG: T9SS type B sorting domain-containing protein [Flavobacteriaceae bacterium]|nr:MAG: T9SS type B sorting domain-containing protein [Flavobacteriaceae bacterium]
MQILRSILFYFSLIVSIQLHAQKEGDIWYFGNRAGLDFSTGSVTVLQDSQMDARKGSASISDSDGNLLFYTDGLTVWNKNHQVMPNGTGLSQNGILFTLTTVPIPNSNGKYLVLIINTNGRFEYSEIDMSLDGGLGDVTNKRVLIESSIDQRITAVNHANGNDVWVITHTTGTFFSYLVTDSGLSSSPVETVIGGNYTEDGFNSGYIKLAPNGKKLAIGHTIDNVTEIFDFDTSTGIPSNPIEITDDEDVHPHGLEFSSNGNILYVTGLFAGDNSQNGVLQYNLLANDIAASKVKLTGLFPLSNWAAIQAAPDGKIYITRAPNQLTDPAIPYLSVINNPNILGTGCDFQKDAIDLGTGSAELGLPIFIQSFFNVGFQFENTCEGDVTEFFANISESYDSLEWGFGDGTTSTLENPTHIYASSGQFTVTLTVNVGSQTFTDSQEVIIFKAPQANSPQNLLICDDDNDGFSSFDLSLQSNAILGSQNPSGFNITYYASIADYTNNNPIADSSNYTNLIAFTLQTIVASVKNTHNSDCEAITTFDIQVFESPIPSTNLSPLKTCDTDNDGFSVFDLTLRETSILNGQDPTDFEVIYYASQTDYDNNNPITDPSNYINTAVTTQNIVVSVHNVQNATCEATTNFDIQVFESPTPSTSVPSILVCDDNNDGFFNFNLKSQDTTILNGQDPSMFTVTYFASQDDFDNNNPITDPNNYINNTRYTLQTIVASVQNNGNTECIAITTFEIQVFESPTPSTNVPTLSFCDNTSVGTDTDGRIEFDLTQNTTAILDGQSASDFTVNYYTDSGLINQIPNPTEYQNTNPNETIYVQVVNIQNTNCTASTSFDIEVYELPEVTSVVELKQCDDDLDGFSVFNLTEVNAELSANEQNETITFYELQSEAQSGSNAITNTTAYTNETVSTDAVWARIENANSCYRIAQVNLTVSTTQIPSSLLREFYQCGGTDTTDGVATFDFSSVNAEIQSLFPVGQQLIINYYRNQADALSEINPITDISNYQNVGYPNSQNIYVRVDSELDNDCLGLGHHITLHVETVPVAHPVVISEQCDGDRDGLFAFDTSNIESTILNGQTNVSVTYKDQSGNTLPSPLPNPFITASQTITATVVNTNSQDPDGACFDETTINFTVIAVPIANPLPVQEQCDDDFDGMISFDTSTIESTLLGSQTGMAVEYTDENGILLPSPLPNPFITASQTITARVINPIFIDCYDETTIEFIVRDKPNFELQETDVICITESPQLEVSVQNPSGNYSYEWTDESGLAVSSDMSATITQVGTYTVVATSQFGCLSASKEITIVESEIAMLDNSEIVLVDDSTNNNITIDIANLGIGDYEFSLLDEQLSTLVDFQDDPFFDNLEGGFYTVLIRDKNGCGVLSREISLITFPKFFTPNNDGVNDTWNIKGYSRNLFQNGKVEIFNRFGKRVSFFNIDNDGWDGLYNGRLLPSNDYWFVIELVSTNGRVRRRTGNFSLLRN